MKMDLVLFGSVCCFPAIAGCGLPAWLGGNKCCCSARSQSKGDFGRVAHGWSSSSIPSNWHRTNVGVHMLLIPLIILHVDISVASFPSMSMTCVWFWLSCTDSCVVSDGHHPSSPRLLMPLEYEHSLPKTDRAWKTSSCSLDVLFNWHLLEGNVHHC